jgi:hypothetical protein
MLALIEIGFDVELTGFSLAEIDLTIARTKQPWLIVAMIGGVVILGGIVCQVVQLVVSRDKLRVTADPRNGRTLSCVEWHIGCLLQESVRCQVRASIEAICRFCNAEPMSDKPPSTASTVPVT